MHNITSIRTINRARIISLIRRNPGLTRSQLSLRSGLVKGTISSLTAELLAEGFLREEDPGGRVRNTRLWLNRDAGVAVGIELSPDECRGVLTDMEIRTLRHVQRPLSSTLVEETIEVLHSVTEELLHGVEKRHLGLAIAVPGPTDLGGQRVLYSESLGWYDVPLASRLQERWGFPVTVINRPKAGVLGERWYGAGAGVDNLIYVSISSGVAAGILLGGALVEGEHGHTGEIGHIAVQLDGPTCACGNHGCLEMLASIPALMVALRQRLEQGEPSVLARTLQTRGAIGYQDLIGAARDGDALAR